MRKRAHRKKRKRLLPYVRRSSKSGKYRKLEKNFESGKYFELGEDIESGNQRLMYYHARNPFKHAKKSMHFKVHNYYGITGLRKQSRSRKYRIPKKQLRRAYRYMFPNSLLDILAVSQFDTDENLVGVTVGVTPGGSSRVLSVGDTRGLRLADIENICYQRYGDKDRRVIVIVLARYSIESVQKIVKENYEYWHKISRNEADFYWLGYYLEECEGKVSTPFKPSPDGGVYHLKFDMDTYVDGVVELNEILGKRLGYVTAYLLCDYYEGRIHFEKSVLIQIDDLLELDKDGGKLRKATDCLFYACKREKDAYNAGTIIIDEMKLEKLKVKMGNILSGAGIIMQLFGV